MDVHPRWAQHGGGDALCGQRSVRSSGAARGPAMEPRRGTQVRSPLRLDVVSPAPRTDWRRVVADDPLALPEHTPEWVDALCSTGPYADATRLYRFPDGRDLVLPLVRRTGVTGLGGWLLSYPPAWGMGGLLGEGVDAPAAAAVLDDLRSLRVQRLSIRPDPLRSHLWDDIREGLVAIPRRGHVADLSGGIDTVEQRLPKATRKYIRRAQRSGVRVEVDRTGALLDAYYALYLASVDRWALRQHEPRPLARWRAGRRDPLTKLQALAHHLGNRFVTAMAYVDDKPAFATIMLLGPTAHVTRSAMDIDLVSSTKAGSLVHWTLLQEAVSYGCSRYHLGESGASTSLAQFKESFGAVPLDYHELRLERLPYTRVDQQLRTVVKRALRFRDV